MPNDLWTKQVKQVFCVCMTTLSIFFSGIQDFPENIKCCKCLTIIEASVNPVSKWVSILCVCIPQLQKLFAKWPSMQRHCIKFICRFNLSYSIVLIHQRWGIHEKICVPWNKCGVFPQSKESVGKAAHGMEPFEHRGWCFMCLGSKAGCIPHPLISWLGP